MSADGAGARVACVGVGNVGRSWAVVFARAGLDVALWDADPAAVERARPLIRVALDDLHRAGLVADVEEALGRLHSAATLEEATRGVTHVQESVAEDAAIKRDLYARLDAAAPQAAVLASSTSAIPGSAMFEGATGRGRCLVAHPVNPPHLISLVEICPTPWTDPAAVERTRALMQAVGQSPIVLAREIDGFLLNRLQWALLGEAMHLVGEGYCSAEDIDTVVTQGLAPRWSFIGPFEVAHLNATQGVQGYFGGLKEAIGRVQRTLRTDYPPSTALVDQAHAAMAAKTPVVAIPQRQGWRDGRLLSLKRYHGGFAAPEPPEG